MAGGHTTGHHVDLVVVSGAISLVGVAALAGAGPGLVAPAAALLALLTIARHVVVPWSTAIVMLLVIVLFIPIRRYALAINLPFELEPYRGYVLALAGIWLACLLVDPRARIRLTGLEAPLALLGIAVLGSILTNMESITDEDLSMAVLKKLTFWIAFVLVLYMVASLSSALDADVYLRTLVLGAAALGTLGVVEWKTGTNVFNDLQQLMPFIAPIGDDLETFRAGLNRAYGSAQHPIAYGAALALVLPISVVLAFRRRRPVWFVCAALIILGSLASVSRTSVVMLAVSAVVLAVLKPQAARQALPFALPLLVAIQLALPGTFATTKALFLPEEGLVEQQAEASAGSGRVASLGPAIDEASEHPFFGRGFGTRLVGSDPRANSIILDDEWLTTTLEIGLVGAIAWLWIFWRFCGRAMRAAREGDDDRHWLLAALAASVASFAVGMVFFDAFSFIQVTLIMIVLLGIGAVLLRQEESSAERAAARAA